MGDSVTLDFLKYCDFGCSEIAQYDAKTVGGSWANMCESHWQKYGIGRLGTGLGQRLIYKEGAKP